MRTVLVLVVMILAGCTSTALPPDAPVMVLADGSIIGGSGAQAEDVATFQREVVAGFGVDNLVGCADGKMVAVRATGDSFFVIRDWTRPEERSALYPGEPYLSLEHGYLLVSRPDGDVLFDTTTLRELALPVEFIAFVAVERGLFVGIGMDDWRQGRTVVRDGGRGGHNPRAGEARVRAGWDVHSAGGGSGRAPLPFFVRGWADAVLNAGWAGPRHV